MPQSFASTRIFYGADQAIYHPLKEWQSVISGPSAVQRLKHLHVDLMNALARPAERFGLYERARRRRSRTAKYLVSLTAIHNSRRLVRLDLPWWTFRAIDRVQDFIDGRDGQVQVLEWGSGASTVWLARRCTSVVTVENDEAFLPIVRQLIAGLDNVTLLAQPGTTPDGPIHAPSEREGFRGLEFQGYVTAPRALGRRFDLIIVDGRARPSCLAEAISLLADDGMIVFDNTGRKRYSAALADPRIELERLPGLTPCLPYPDETSLIRLAGQRR